ncbi:ParM/StbA family protein [Priestia filamentosa]|uniref:ParM/StbA family protein n=1 Tax=Priestia filamentosa TaxID=1402861 RepID=UPI00397BA9D5
MNQDVLINVGNKPAKIKNIIEEKTFSQQGEVTVRPIAVDCGNLSVKSKSDIGEVIYPNTIKTAEALKQQSVFGNKIKNKSMVYEYNDERLIIGEVDENSRFSLDVNTSRYKTEDFKKMFILAVFKHVNEGDHVRVVTGIPGKQYSDATMRKEAIRDIQSLQGEHIVNGKRFIITDIQVELQPTATTNYLAFTEDGDFKEGGEEFATSHILVVDLGMGSSDVTTIKKGLMQKVDELQYSMFDIYEKIIEFIRERESKDGEPTILATEHFKAQLIEKQIRESLECQDGRATYKATNGDTFDIHSEVEKAFQWGAMTFLQELRNKKINFEEYANVVLTGGGTQALLPYLKKGLMDYKGNSKVRFRLPTNRLMANARGYYVVAKNPEMFARVDNI